MGFWIKTRVWNCKVLHNGQKLIGIIRHIIYYLHSNENMIHAATKNLITII